MTCWRLEPQVIIWWGQLLLKSWLLALGIRSICGSTSTTFNALLLVFKPSGVRIYLIVLWINLCSNPAHNMDCVLALWWLIIQFPVPSYDSISTLSKLIRTGDICISNHSFWIGANWISSIVVNNLWSLWIDHLLLYRQIL